MRLLTALFVLAVLAGCTSLPGGRVVDLTRPSINVHRPEKITETRSDGSQTIYDFTK